jgi:DNA-binding IclR family transcriptional regulator
LMLVAAAVLTGHVSNKPRTASEIARYLGFPRVTTQRKLDALMKQCLVARRGTRYCMQENTYGDLDEWIDRAIGLIKRTAHEL